MIQGWMIIAMIILTTLLVLRVFRKPIRNWLLRLRAKMQIHSLRNAIAGADEDKAETGRKNMVVYNTVSGEFEPLQKRVLKRISNNAKRKNNSKMTDGRKWAQQNGKTKTGKRYFTHKRVKETEKKSLYVTE